MVKNLFPESNKSLAVDSNWPFKDQYKKLNKLTEFALIWYLSKDVNLFEKRKEP